MGQKNTSNKSAQNNKGGFSIDAEKMKKFYSPCTGSIIKPGKFPIHR